MNHRVFRADAWRPLLACAAGLIAAFGLGRWSASGPAARPARPVPSSPAPSPSEPVRVRGQATARLAADRWAAGATHADLPATEEDRIALLRNLGAADPAAALALAATEPNWGRRTRYVHAALRGWATRDPVAAAGWLAAHLRAHERPDAFRELANGAAEHPDAARAAAAELCRADPDNAAAYGTSLLEALANRGAFADGVAFATTAPERLQAQWTGIAFATWARHQPEAAAAAALAVADPAQRSAAWQGAVSAWAESDPASLVGFGERLPAGPARHALLHDGLMHWLEADPAGAMTWMERLAPGEVFDDGAAAVATTPELAIRRPDLALTWIRAIDDPARRSAALANLIREWAARDPGAAAAFAGTTRELLPSDRVAVQEDLAGAAK